MNPGKRPLSPHLQVYKPQITSVLSIFHRLSGVFLCLGVVALCVWAIGLAYGPHVFEWGASFYKTILGKLFFAAVIAAYFYHFSNGIRHLFWDSGHGFSLPTLRKTGYFVLGFAAFMTVLYLFLMMGA